MGVSKNENEHWSAEEFVFVHVCMCVCVQLRLPRQQQCAGAQLRLLTDSLGGLERVNRTAPFSLQFAAESCAGQVKVGPGRAYLTGFDNIFAPRSNRDQRFLRL